MLEVIATSLEDAVKIEEYGGDRIELVSTISEGGLTPSLALIKEVTKQVKIPVMVMVRPHSKSFVYDRVAFEGILADIEEIKKTKTAGIVFGSLSKEGRVDLAQLDAVIEQMGSLKLTYHRAIDSSSNILEDTSKICERNVQQILSSGGEQTADKGIETLQKMMEIGASNQVKILVGSGVNEGNIFELKNQLNTTEFHVGSAAKIEGSNDNPIEQKRIVNLQKFLQKF